MARGRKKDELYLGKYLIGLYDDLNGDELIALLDNAHDFAEWTGCKIETARVNLMYFYHGWTKHLYYKGKILTVYFIRIDEDD